MPSHVDGIGFRVLSTKLQCGFNIQGQAWYLCRAMRNQFLWNKVKSHIGNDGNETADQSAEMGAVGNRRVWVVKFATDR